MMKLTIQAFAILVGMLFLDHVSSFFTPALVGRRNRLAITPLRMAEQQNKPQTQDERSSSERSEKGDGTWGKWGTVKDYETDSEPKGSKNETGRWDSGTGDKAEEKKQGNVIAEEKKQGNAKERAAANNSNTKESKKESKKDEGKWGAATLTGDTTKTESDTIDDEPNPLFLKDKQGNTKKD
jgi:hypothetical protein